MGHRVSRQSHRDGTATSHRRDGQLRVVAPWALVLVGGRDHGSQLGQLFCLFCALVVDEHESRQAHLRLDSQVAAENRAQEWRWTLHGRGKNRQLVAVPPNDQRGGHRLQLVFTSDLLRLVDQLKRASEAESYGELIRRALICLEEYRPESEDEKVVPFPDVRAHRQSGCTERKQVVLPERTMRRLERLKAELKEQTGSGSYAEVIRQALMVFAQDLRNRGKLGSLDAAIGGRKEGERCEAAR